MPETLISHLPRPLFDDLVEGRAVPIVGAGFSANAITPDGAKLPQWRELGQLLAADVPGLQYDNPIDAVSSYEQEYGRMALVERLRALLRLGDAQPGFAHRAFCALGFERVVTTNFDLLLEQAYQMIGKPCLPVIEEQQLSAGNPYSGPLLLKFHGDLHHPLRLVATEGDYDRFLHAYPLIATYLGALLIDHTAMLIGYSLDDPDMRQIISLLRERLGGLRRPLWTILVGAAPALVSRYDRRGVKVVNIPAKRNQSYGEVLGNLFEELRESWRTRVIDESQSSNERARAELRLPPEAGRICYFAVPLSLLSWYRENLFPVAEQFGFVPMAARDVISPSGTASAKVDALIQRAYVVVTDLSMSNATYELGLALAHLGSERVAVILREGATIPSSLANVRVIRVSDDLIEATGEMIGSFAQFLAKFVDDVSSWENEPQRLLNAGEYRAAIVSAVSLLESELLRSVLLGDRIPGRPPGLRNLIRAAVDIGILDASRATLLDDIIDLRNRVVHSQIAVRRQDAEEAVRAVLETIQHLSR